MMRVITPRRDELKGKRGVYVLHFEQPFGHARHYTGYSEDIAGRIWHHSHGTGANLMKHVVDAGIEFRVAVVYLDADREKERRLKNSGSASRYCPICKAYHKDGHDGQ